MIDALFERGARELLLVAGKGDARRERVGLSGEEDDHRNVRRLTSGAVIHEAASLHPIMLAPLGGDAFDGWRFRPALGCADAGALVCDCSRGVGDGHVDAIPRDEWRAESRLEHHGGRARLRCPRYLHVQLVPTNVDEFWYANLC